ncbi:Uncharacterised protein [Brevibacterium casei]|uniref:Uncharacterized protein n=1 Tax=Brevibacterium casei TaxID=33889 RepID=A0A449D8A9_9MICO|nr:Uncharacterised protein [Brevibacterium casei]
MTARSAGDTAWPAGDTEWPAGDTVWPAGDTVWPAGDERTRTSQVQRVRESRPYETGDRDENAKVNR